MQGAQVDQDVYEGVLIGDRLSVAQLGVLDTQRDGLTVDALGSSALFVNLFVSLAVSVKLVPDAGADAGRDGGDATLGPVFVLDGAGLTGGLREQQRADVAAALVLEKRDFGDEGVLERHRQTGLAQG